jgi:hypothetical protein
MYITVNLTHDINVRKKYFIVKLIKKKLDLRLPLDLKKQELFCLGSWGNNIYTNFSLRETIFIYAFTSSLRFFTLTSHSFYENII